MIQINQRKRRTNRHGAAVVEAALMLPLLVLTTFGSVDVAQYINAAQIVSNSSREGARVTSRNGTANISEVKSAVLAYLADAFPQLNEVDLEQAVSISILNAGNGNTAIENGDLNTVVSGDPLVVTVNFDFTSIRWLAGPLYQNLSTATYCRRE